MRTRLQNDLLLLNILTVALILIVSLVPPNALRVALGLPLVLFFPGYALTAALFPRKSSLDGMERVGLSFGANIAVVSLVGLIINYTPWGIKLYPVLILLAVFIAIASGIAWYRRLRLAGAEQFTISFHFNLTFWRGQNFIDKVLSVILIAAILGAAGTLGYVLATPEVGEKFTEFYILGLEGKAIDYPGEMKTGEQGKVRVGIINREQTRASYRIKIRVDGEENSEVGPLVLEPDEKWEEVVGFTPSKVGDNQKVEFFLYKDTENEPYQKPLHLWINVKE